MVGEVSIGMYVRRLYIYMFRSKSAFLGFWVIVNYISFEFF